MHLILAQHLISSIMASAADEDLAASKTDGFKVGEKKTVEEYAKLGKLALFHGLSLSIPQRSIRSARSLLQT